MLIPIEVTRRPIKHMIARTGRLWSLILVCGVVASVQAQQPVTPAKQTVIVSSKDDVPAQPVPPVDPLDDDRSVYWTLHDAITTALENNVDIAIERKNLRIGEFNLRSAEGVYEPVLLATPSFNSANQPNIGRFSGLSSNENSTKTSNLSLNAGVQKQFRTEGGSFTASFDNPRTTSNSAIVSPLYSPQLSFSYTQPLFRNRRIDFNRLQILVAKKNLTLTDAQFRQQVISTIFQVQQAYWNLAYAQRNVSVQNDGLDLAQKLVDQNQKQVDVGMLAPLEVDSAKTTLEIRRQALIQAQNTAFQAETALKNLVVNGTQSPIWSKDIFPTDFFDEQPSGQSLSDDLNDGYSKRPEVDQFKAQRHIDKSNIDYYHDQTKPQIDLVSSYSIAGAGGTPTSTLTCPTGSSLASNGLCAPGNISPSVTTSSVNSRFVGGYGTAIGSLLTNKYNTVTVGLSISFPFHNKTAQANLGKALATESQTELQERKQLQTIEAEVRNAYQAVLLSKKNLDAARLARQYAEIQLDGEQKKFASGLSTTFLVLTQQNALIQAKGAEISALSAYNTSVAALQQASGTTLESNEVEIK
ncbi:MAG: TolC family protein [Acidobacteriota bacterium]